MSFSITVDVLCPKIVAKFYVHPLDFSHGILGESDAKLVPLGRGWGVRGRAPGAVSACRRYLS